MGSLGERLRVERERLGYTQSQMAECGGVRKGAQINYEKGERSPDGAYFAGIAAAGADVSYVITGARAVPVDAPVLNRREAALLDNYRHTSEEGKAVVEATALAAAKPLKNKKAV